MVLPGKHILQELCRIGHGWDEELPKQTLTAWRAWQRSFQTMTMVNVPRCYKPTGFKELKSIELHHFADASTEGYGTASYLHLTDSNDNIHCTLIMGESRVAPLRQSQYQDCS